MKEGEEIDKLFKKRLEDPGDNLAYNEDDWDAFEQMIDSGKKRPFVIFRLPLLSGIAAMLLLVAGWWFFKAKETTAIKPGGQIVKTKPVMPVDSNGKTKPGNSPVVAPVGPANNVAENKAPGHGNEDGNLPLNNIGVTAGKERVRQNSGAAVLAASGLNTPQVDRNSAVATNNVAPIVNANSGVLQKDTVPPSRASVVAAQKDTVPPGKANLVAMQKDTVPPAKVGGANNVSQAIIAQTQPVKVKAKVQGFGANRPRFAISVLASGDVTGVNSLNQGKAGSNFGAMFSVSLKKWTVTTGAMYAIKPYATSFGNYTTAYKFRTDPTEVTADCRMLDIPLNIAYQVYQKGRNKFALGTGLTSYFMLHENYKYTYMANATGPVGYQVANPKNYLLSTVNLNATFEHQVNSKFSLSVQPYMKLPLKAVGYSQVNLHTAGVAVGFNWNINSFTKPK